MQSVLAHTRSPVIEFSLNWSCDHISHACSAVIRKEPGILLYSQIIIRRHNYVVLQLDCVHLHGSDVYIYLNWTTFLILSVSLHLNVITALISSVSSCMYTSKLTCICTYEKLVYMREFKKHVTTKSSALQQVHA